MDGHDDGGQQSSLPSSLIPHLFRHPPLRHYDPDTAPPRHRAPALDPPFVPDPPPPPPALRTPLGLYALPPVWGEGEPGPSSLRARRATPPHLDIYGRPPANYDHADLVRDRDPYVLPPGPPPPGPLVSQSYHADLLLPDLDPAPFFPAHPYPFSPPGQRPFSPPGTRPFRSPASPAASLPYARSDSYAPDDDGPHTDLAPGRRRRPQSAPQQPPADDPAAKGPAPRKTAVACNFCRGRKLRCNGARPTCAHCAARKIHCEYVSTPKRRGPGKAPKGSRSKRADAVAAGGSGSDRPPLPTYELAAQAPEMHPYTHVMSLDTLDVFSFQPPAPPPPRFAAPDPAREYRRSPEDWSGAERD